MSVAPIKSVTLQEFLSGEILRYRGFDFRPVEAVYRVGDGVYLERKGEDLGKVDAIADDRAATRLYHTLTRKPQT